ncbi:hypothetical protein [Maricaulis sp.]|uniref:hypothetical protein n=1 Tax=Maricaulis sp. TaxID=1486257 RepID=UPI002B272FB9|nr:hypothetical protein [Maricaulis sp.]
MQIARKCLWPLKWALGLEGTRFALVRKLTTQEAASIEFELSNSAYNAKVYFSGKTIEINWVMKSISLIFLSAGISFFFIVGSIIAIYGIMTISIFNAMLGAFMSLGVVLVSRLLIASYRETPKKVLSDLLFERRE